MHISTIIEKNSSDKRRPLSSAEAPPGYPNKNSNNGKKKKESARRTMGKQKGWSEVGAEPLFFPFPSSPARTICPAPNDKNGPLPRREPDTGEGN